MKEVYETPKMEVVEFDTEDVIITSGIGGDSGNDLPVIPIEY